MLLNFRAVTCICPSQCALSRGLFATAVLWCRHSLYMCFYDPCFIEFRRADIDGAHFDKIPQTQTFCIQKAKD